MIRYVIRWHADDPSAEDRRLNRVARPGWYIHYAKSNRVMRLWGGRFASVADACRALARRR